MKYLVDTNVLSELRKRKSDPAVHAWFDARQPWELYVSVLTIGEISIGAHRMAARDAQQAIAIQDWLRTMITEFDSRILPVTASVATQWGSLARIRTVAEIDGLIAATALVHGCVVVTRNVSHFEGLGFGVQNPFGR